MNKYQYKERDYAIDILKSGFTSKYIATELKVLAKYYKSQGKDETEIKTLLHEFCKKYMNGFNDAIHFKIINNAVSYSIKNKLIQIDNVRVTNNELKFIEQLDLAHDYKRVVFTLMILSKLEKLYLELKDGEVKTNQYYFGGHKNYKELVVTSKITFNKKKKSIVKNIHDLIHILDEKKIIQITHNGNIKLLFLYEIENDEEVLLSVKEYSVIGLYYDLYYGENKIKECEICNFPIKVTGKHKKYCKECAIEIKKNQNKIADKKYKDKMKNSEKL
jgi:hypothetical protein